MTHLLGVLESLTRDAAILGRSVGTTRGRLIRSIVGTPESWGREDELSELTYFRKLLDERRRDLMPLAWRSPGDVWNALRSIDRLRARFAPLPLFGDRPGSIRQHAPDRFEREAWFFVNGVATDKEVLRLNGRMLTKLFRRPIELIYNPTDGVFVDLLECVTGRTFDFASETASYALERLTTALSNPKKERVILMGHSQGGIIVSNVVAGLIERFGGEGTRLAKLEVYTFASASDYMPIDPELYHRKRQVPIIEHFANTGDLVARLGVLEKRLPIKGKVYLLDKPGHLLNAHYLFELDGTPRYAWPGPRGRQRDARLYQYLDGQTPDLLPLLSGAEAGQAKRASTGATRTAPANRRPRAKSGSRASSKRTRRPRPPQAQT